MVPKNSNSPIYLNFSKICITLPASEDRFAHVKGAHIVTPDGRALFEFLAGLFRFVRSRMFLHVGIPALQHQPPVCHRSSRRPQVRRTDRIVWSWLSRGGSRWREALVFVQSATVLAWQCTRCRDHWTRLSRRESGRPAIRQ